MKWMACYNCWVTSTGEVYVPRQDGLRTVPQSLTRKGYFQVGIHSGLTKQLHRLVAEAFVPNPEGKPCVDHIDGDRQNNSLDNLRWVSYSENRINQHTGRVWYVATEHDKELHRKHCNRYYQKIRSVRLTADNKKAQIFSGLERSCVTSSVTSFPSNAG